jgi:hypothetical protein
MFLLTVSFFALLSRGSSFNSLNLSPHTLFSDHSSLPRIGYISANCPTYPGVGCNAPVCYSRSNSRFCWQNYQYCENITSQDTCESHSSFGCSYGYGGGSSNAGAIAGGVIGGLLAIALIGGIIFFLYRNGTLSSLGNSFTPPTSSGQSSASSARPSGSGFWSVSERPSTVYTPVPAQENYGSYRPPTVAMAAPIDLSNPAVASVTIVSDQPTISLDPPHANRASVVL